MLSIQVLQVWTNERMDTNKLKIATKFEMALEETPLYMNILSSRSRRKRNRECIELNEHKQKLVPNQVVSTAIPDMYFIMTLYSTARWKRTTVLGSIVHPIDDLSKNTGPVWCNMVRWNNKLHSVETTGRVLFRLVSTNSFILQEDNNCGSIPSCPKQGYWLYGSGNSSLAAEADTRFYEKEATAPCE